MFLHSSDLFVLRQRTLLVAEFLVSSSRLCVMHPVGTNLAGIHDGFLLALFGPRRHRPSWQGELLPRHQSGGPDLLQHHRIHPGKDTSVHVIRTANPRVCSVCCMLQESIMDFYWHYSTLDIDLAGKQSFCRAITVAGQMFAVLTEYIQVAPGIRCQVLGWNLLLFFIISPPPPNPIPTPAVTMVMLCHPPLDVPCPCARIIDLCA